MAFQQHLLFPTRGFSILFSILVKRCCLANCFMLFTLFLSLFILGPATRVLETSAIRLCLSLYLLNLRISEWYHGLSLGRIWWVTLIHKVMDFISYCSFIYSHVSWECHHALNSDLIKLHNAERRYIPADDIIRNTTTSEIN